METSKLPYCDGQNNCFILPDSMEKNEIIADIEKAMSCCAENSNLETVRFYSLIMEPKIKKRSRFPIYALVLIITKKHGINGFRMLSSLFQNKLRVLREALEHAAKASVTPVLEFKIILENTARKIGVCLKDIHLVNLRPGNPDKSPIAQ